MRKFIRTLVSRAVITGFLFLLQILLILLFVLEFSAYYLLFQICSIILGLICSLLILEKNGNPAYKIAWLFPMIVFPIFGAILYLTFGSHKLSERKRKKMMIIDKEQKKLCSYFDSIIPINDDPDGQKQANYLQYKAYAPAYANDYSELLSSGEVKLNKMLEELNKAEHFIFLEYFIIREGEMWSAVLEILKSKAKSGVDVRIIYDDFGSIVGLSKDYPQKMEKFGIKCCVFNRIKPELSPRLNNRDHRKICVIDGKVGFTGGINIADEYINKQQRCGHWKDTSIMLKGRAVTSLTVMFLGMWEYVTKHEENVTDFVYYGESGGKSDGYVIPYSDNPLDDEPVGQNVYLNLIYSAKKYLYITTPYLIIENEMTTALCNAAKSGVDVRIITPHIPDKRFIFSVTRSNYEVLLDSGVKIFEYTPGFVHAKMFVCDDKYATIGTVNLDYRSLYLHYECGVWLAHSKSVVEIRDDIMETLDVCEQIPEDFSKNTPFKRLAYGIIRAFAPLL